MFGKMLPFYEGQKKGVVVEVLEENIARKEHRPGESKPLREPPEDLFSESYLVPCAPSFRIVITSTETNTKRLSGFRKVSQIELLSGPKL